MADFEFLNIVEEVTTNPDTCSEREETLIKNIQEAVEFMNKKIDTYTSYELNLSQEEIELFDKLSIVDYQGFERIIGNFEKTSESFQTQIIQLLNNVGKTPDINKEIAEECSQVILRLIQNMKEANSHEYFTASVKAVPHLEDALKYKHNINLYEKYPRRDWWHIDRSINEILFPENSDLAGLSEPVFIMVLKGNTTLYYPQNPIVRETFINEAKKTLTDFSIPDEKLQNFQNIMDTSNAQSVPIGYGTIHFSGKNEGTIHATPYPHPRLVILATPIKEEYIEPYKKIFAAI